MNAIELLKMDHERVDQLFDQIDTADDLEQKKKIFLEIKREIEGHSEIEETIFYPTFAKRESFQELIEDSYDDHQEMKDLLLELESIMDAGEWEERIGDLMDCVDEHVEIEEEELFPMVEEVLDADELERLGSEMESARPGGRPRAA